MRLYKIKASGQGDVLTKIVWVGSAAEGVAARKVLYAEGFARKEVTEVQVDIPTDKISLLEYLNGNMT
jgi:hypothetical protein